MNKPLIVQYEPPKGILPVMVGTIIDQKIDYHDVYAGILYLAEKKYISLEPIFSGDRAIKPRCRAVLLRIDVESFPLAERKIIQYLFPDKKSGAIIEDMGDISISMMFVEIYKLTEPDLIAQGYVTNIPRKKKINRAGILCMIFGVIGFFTGGIIDTINQTQSFVYIVAILLFLAGGVLLIYGHKFNLTLKGKEAQNHLFGFKEFLRVTEYPRYESMSNPKMPNFMLYENLPFAVALGVEDHWSDFFDEVFDVEQHGLQKDKNNRYYKYY